jgi:hypothetical protein
MRILPKAALGLTLLLAFGTGLTVAYSDEPASNDLPIAYYWSTSKSMYLAGNFQNAMVLVKSGLRHYPGDKKLLKLQDILVKNGFSKLTRQSPKRKPKSLNVIVDKRLRSLQIQLEGVDLWNESLSNARLRLGDDFMKRKDINSWTFKVKDSKGAVVYSAEGRGLPPKELIWDGTNSKGEGVPHNLFAHYEFRALDKQGRFIKASQPLFNPRFGRQKLASYVFQSDSLWDIAGRPEVLGDPSLFPLLVDANFKAPASPPVLTSGLRLSIPQNVTKEMADAARIKGQTLPYLYFAPFSPVSTADSALNESIFAAARKRGKKVKSYLFKTDTLWGIAARPDVYGDPELYPLLVDANLRKIIPAVVLLPGTRLTIPRDCDPQTLDQIRLRAWSPEYTRWRGTEINKETFVSRKNTVLRKKIMKIKTSM